MFSSSDNEVNQELFELFTQCVAEDDFSEIDDYLIAKPKKSLDHLNENHETIIHLLCKLKSSELSFKTHEDICRIVKRVAGYNEQNLSAVSVTNSTPLHYAIAAGNQNLVKILLEYTIYSANPNLDSRSNAFCLRDGLSKWCESIFSKR